MVGDGHDREGCDGSSTSGLDPRVAAARRALDAVAELRGGVPDAIGDQAHAVIFAALLALVDPGESEPLARAFAGLRGADPRGNRLVIFEVADALEGTALAMAATWPTDGQHEEALARCVTRLEDRIGRAPKADDVRDVVDQLAKRQIAVSGAAARVLVRSGYYGSHADLTAITRACSKALADRRRLLGRSRSTPVGE